MGFKTRIRLDGESPATGNGHFESDRKIGGDPRTVNPAHTGGQYPETAKGVVAKPRAK